MSGLFEKRVYCIHEAVGAAELHESYRITDETGKELLGEAEEQSCIGNSIAKLFDKSWFSSPSRRRCLGTEPRTERCRRRPYAKIVVKNAEGAAIAVLNEAGCAVKPRLDVSAPDGSSLGTVRGDLLGRTFSFEDTSGGRLARIEHLWGGLARELMTTADDYRIDIAGDLAKAPLVLAATIAIDLIWHES